MIISEMGGPIEGMFEAKPKGDSRYICTQAPAESSGPYGGRCGATVPLGSDCGCAHQQRPVPFSRRVAEKALH